MQINLQKMKKKLSRENSITKLKLPDSISLSLSKDKGSLFSKKRNQAKETEKENWLPCQLNSNDSILRVYLNEKPTKKTTEDLKKSISKLKSTHLTFSKESILELIEKIKIQNEAIEESGNSKLKLTQKEIKNDVNQEFLDLIKTRALKNLVNEQFDEVVNFNAKSIKDSDKTGEIVQRLFQKEMLFEQSLNLLSEDDVDINQLLFCAFERIQSENYCPPSGQSRFLDGHFEFADQLKMPTSKWLKDKKKAKEFQLKFECIQAEDSR